jgi:transcriptional regulator of acetoin/glycerol metabolism
MIGEAEQRILLKYPWPGNVRELQNVLERAVIAGRSDRLDLRGMLPTLRGIRKERPQTDRILTEAEMNAIWEANIRRALEACSGRVAGRDGAAALLGIPPTTLSSRIRKSGIN